MYIYITGATFCIYPISSLWRMVEDLREFVRTIVFLLWYNKMTSILMPPELQIVVQDVNLCLYVIIFMYVTGSFFVEQGSLPLYPRIFMWFFYEWQAHFLANSYYKCQDKGNIACRWHSTLHYNDVIMDTMESQITSLMIVYSTVYSGAYQRKHQISASLAFVRGIHRWPVNSPLKGSVTRKMFPFDDVIMITIGPVFCWTGRQFAFTRFPPYGEWWKI